ncbi:type II toxin-antitoxin system VapC family toxin [Treponema primitia]|uniref:type II toxin-antitoxin system VapC family toxin n=1 Tax=Treponema primitia TaxID=88058 RepID=UPI00397F2FA4
MKIITFDTTGAIDEIKTGKVMESTDPEIQSATKIISVIVRIELFSKPKLDAEEYAKRLFFLERVSVIPLNRVIQDETIHLRQYTSLKLPDAIIAATAVKTGAVLLTYDGHFEGLGWPGLTVKKSI